MMIWQIFTVYDIKAEAYLRPFYEQTKGSAIRAFSDACNDPNHHFHKHAEDYVLIQLGTYDDSTGEIVRFDIAETVGKALDYLITE